MRASAALKTEEPEVKYAWREGYPTSIDPQAAGEVLIRIAGKDESTIAQEIVDKARNPASPLHPAFEWNDATAADEFRRLQARNVINAIRIIDPETGDLVRVFVHLEESDDLAEPAYMTVSAVMSNKNLRAQCLNDALRSLRAWRSRYDQFKELARVYEAIDKTTR